MFNDEDLNSNNLRVIKTARNEEEINKAAKNSFFPLIKKVEPSSKIRSKFAIFQNQSTGEIEVIGDYRSSPYSGDDKNGNYKLVLDFSFYYPYKFESPYAAYLIPNGLKVGERVFLEDLIEDYVGSSWNQGDTYRLEACEAIWNGREFVIQYNPENNRRDFIG